MHRFQLIQPFLRVAAPGDILVPTIGNVSTFGTLKVLPTQSITLPAFTNISVLRPPSVVEGTSANISLPALTNASSFPALTVQEAPADSNIRLPALGSSTSFPALTVQAAPADGEIRLPALTNTSTFPTLAVNPDELVGSDDKNDPMIGGGSIGGRMS